MMNPCDESIKKTLKLVEDMLGLADEGDAVREDTRCGVLYGVVRDSALRSALKEFQGLYFGHGQK
jgi:hypothetical protein